MVCPNCGAKLSNYHVFCTSCGRMVDNYGSDGGSPAPPRKKIDYPIPDPVPPPKEDRQADPAPAEESIGIDEGKDGGPASDWLDDDDDYSPPPRKKKSFDLSAKWVKPAAIGLAAVLVLVLGIVGISSAAHKKGSGGKAAVTAAPANIAAATAKPTARPLTTQAPTASPAPTPEPTPEPSQYELLVIRSNNYDPDVEVPLESEMLDEPLIFYIVGSNPNSSSGGMYLCRSPAKDMIKVLKSHTAVTVHAVRGSLAKKNGYAFVETKKGQFGWVSFKATRGIGLSETNDF